VYIYILCKHLELATLGFVAHRVEDGQVCALETEDTISISISIDRAISIYLCIYTYYVSTWNLPPSALERTVQRMGMFDALDTEDTISISMSIDLASHLYIYICVYIYTM